MSGPLSGVKVIELAHVMAGPVAGLMLADMGADVIKVERPAGDDTRHSGPFVEGEAASYMMMNRNKRGIVLNLKDPEQLAALREMIRTADVVLENYRKGTMERLGLGYNVLKADNPGLVYGSISGFGRTGPYADRAGIRPDRPGYVGSDGGNRRRSRQAALQGRAAGQRHYCGDPACHGGFGSAGATARNR